MASIVVLEALGTGAGLKFVQAAIDGGHDLTFVSRDHTIYSRDLKYDCLKEARVIDGVQTRSIEAVTSVLDQLARTQKLDLVTATGDAYLDITTALPPRLAALVPNRGAIQRLRNKYCLRQAQRDLGLLAIQCFEVENAAQALEAAGRIASPVVVKPSHGTGSYGVSLAANSSDVRRAFDRARTELKGGFESVLVEQYVPGPLYSAEVLVENGRFHILGFTDRVLSPLPSFAEINDTFGVCLGDELTTCVTKAIASLLSYVGLDSGIAHVEFIASVEGPFIVEVNPRLGGAFLGPMMNACLSEDVYGCWIDALTEAPVRIPALTGRGASQHGVFSNTTGLVHSIDSKSAQRLEGVMDCLITAKAGDEINETLDQRSELGILWAVGPNPDAARRNVKRAAAEVRIDVR